jgi:NodT family efflux transporter outer membrane factor (OMF) lipoprotein
VGAGLDAAWELDVFGGIREGIAAAEFDAVATEANMHATRVAITAEVARNYVEARRAQRRKVDAETNAASLAQLVELAQYRERAGIGAIGEVLRAQIGLDQARAQIAALDATFELDALAIDLLLGAAPGSASAQLAAPAALPAPDSSIAVGIPADVLRQRPDVQAAEANVRAALARVEVADAARYPSFRLSGSVGLESLTRVSVGSGAAATYSLLAGVTAPIFEGGRLRAQVEQSDAAAEQAEIAWEAALNGALADVEAALVSLADATERVALLGPVVEHSAEATRLAHLSFDAGLVDVSVVLDAEQSQLSVADNLANAEADVVLGVIQLYRALGGGWSAESDPIRSNAGNP